MAVPRIPLTLPFRTTLRRVYTRGIKYDLWNTAMLDTVLYEQDFLGNQASIPGEFTAGGAGTPAAVSALALGGALQLVTTGVNLTGSSMWMGQSNYTADQNPVLTVRVKLSAITAVKVEIGFADNINANTLAASGVGLFISPLVSPPTMVALSAGQTDTAIAAILDTTSAVAPTTSANWRLVSAKGAGPTTQLVTPSTSTPAAFIAPVANTYQYITLRLRRIAIASEDVAADLYVNQSLLATIPTGAGTFNKALFPYIIVVDNGSSSRTLTIDKWFIVADRDTTA